MNIFLLFYLLFVFSVIVMGSFTIGPLTVRVYMTLLMILCLLFAPVKRKHIKSDSYMTIFVIFILLTLFSMGMNGDAEDYGIKWVMGYHFVCIVLYFATKKITRIETQKRLDLIVASLCLITIFDAGVTILQYYNNPIGWGINILLSQGRNDSTMDIVNSSITSEESLSGIAGTSGIFDSVVGNSIYLCSYGILPFCLFKRKSTKKNIFALCTLLFTYVACFMCQERAALATLTLSLVFLIYKSVNSKSVLWFLIFIPLLLSVLFFLDNSNIDLGRFQEWNMENDSRKDIWGSFGAYFQNNGLWGGVGQFRAITGRLPHNFFLNAFVFGGLLGGLTIILLFFLILYRCYVNVRRKDKSFITIVFSVSLLSLLAQGIVHNTSLVTGDVNIFLLLALMIVSEKLYDHIPINEKSGS